MSCFERGNIVQVLAGRGKYRKVQFVEHDEDSDREEVFIKYKGTNHIARVPLAWVLPMRGILVKMVTPVGRRRFTVVRKER